MEDIDISNSHLALEKLAESSTTQSFRHEEEQLRLKSRCLWIKAGDKNTADFHRQCRIKLSRNHILEVAIGEGVFVKGQDQLKLYASKRHQLLFQDDGITDKDASSELLLNIPSLVNAEDNYDLMKPFTEQEIINVIWAMESDEAPEPDGFTIHFYKV